MKELLLDVKKVVSKTRLRGVFTVKTGVIFAKTHYFCVQTFTKREHKMKKMNEDGSRRRLYYDLTDTDIKKAKLPKPSLKYYDLRDGKGLYLRITSTGNKIWKIDYYVNKKRNTMTLGYYPQMSLKMAREEALKAKQIAKQGTNPSVDKQQKAVAEQKKKDEESRTFKDVAEKWLEDVVNSSSNIETTKKQKRAMLKEYIYPKIENKIFKDLSYFALSDLVAEIYKSKDNSETKKRKRQEKTDFSRRIASLLNQIWKWAKRKGYCEQNVAEGLKEDFKDRMIIKKQRPAMLDPKSIGKFLNNVDIHIPKSSKVVTEALILIVYLPLRSNELRGAKKDEFDFDSNIWRIPAERMKKRQEHTVPLPKAIAEKIKNLIEFNDDSEYVFPSKTKYITNAGLIRRLEKMGYTKDEVSIHGFRSTFSTLMARTGLYGQEIIDASLAHSIGNATSRTYKRTDYPEKRRQCLEDYCYILDELKKGRDFDDIVKELERQHYEMYMK